MMAPTPKPQAWGGASCSALSSGPASSLNTTVKMNEFSSGVDDLAGESSSGEADSSAAGLGEGDDEPASGAVEAPVEGADADARVGNDVSSGSSSLLGEFDSGSVTGSSTAQAILTPRRKTWLGQAIADVRGPGLGPTRAHVRRHCQ